LLGAKFGIVRRTTKDERRGGKERDKERGRQGEGQATSELLGVDANPLARRTGRVESRVLDGMTVIEPLSPVGRSAAVTYRPHAES
jgi:hypothetical protein